MVTHLVEVPAILVGGIGSIPGAVVGAFIIGICENVIKSTEFTVFSDAGTFALLVMAWKLVK